MIAQSLDEAVEESVENIRTIKLRTPEETVGPFQIALQKTIWRVEMGLSAKLPDSDTVLPNSILQIAPAKNLVGSISQRHEDFEFWLIANGLREFAESFHLFLDDIHITCLWYELATIAPIDDDHIQKLIVEPQAIFHLLDFPKKLKKLNTLFAVSFPEDALNRIRSLNRVRNCYAHRRGVVRSEDVNAAPDSLLVRWLGLRRQTGGKTYPFGIEMNLKHNETYDIVMCPVEKRFRLGDTVSFSANEFAEFGATYFFLAQSIIPKITILAQKCFELKSHPVVV